jgi:hypothetical protein
MNYHWQIEPDGVCTIEGWASVRVHADADGEFNHLEIEAIEIEPAHERHMKIQRGFVPIEDRVPTSEFGQLIEKLVIEQLNGAALDEILELAWSAWRVRRDYYEARLGIC